ncbi:MAG TPA: hypothetical protein VF025_00030, partial [Gaiellaceae bacterium]
RIDELLLAGTGRNEPTPVVETARVPALVALGASIGANSHPLLRHQISAALELGLTITEVTAAVKVAEYVQRRASEMTAEKATHALNAPLAVTAAAAARDVTAATGRRRAQDDRAIGRTPRR